MGLFEFVPGVFMGLPHAGIQGGTDVIDIFRVVDGRIVEHWMQSDSLGMMQ